MLIGCDFLPQDTRNPPSGFHSLPGQHLGYNRESAPVQMSRDPQSPLSSPLPASAVPRLLTEPEPWVVIFFRNFRDLFRRQPPLPMSSRPAPFWPDVFVKRELPRRGLAQSALWHVFALVALYGASMAWFPPPLGQADAFRNRTITYYSVSEYLP